MHPQTDAYFNLTQTGESRWWSWIIVFWFTILGWLGAQLIFTGPVGPILDSVDPELSQQSSPERTWFYSVFFLQGLGLAQFWDYYFGLSIARLKKQSERYSVYYAG